MSKLAQFIQINYGENVSEAARALEIPESTVRKNALPLDNPQFRMPRPAQMARYYVWSGGQVTPNDFYDLPELPEAAMGRAA